MNKLNNPQARSIHALPESGHLAWDEGPFKVSELFHIISPFEGIEISCRLVCWFHESKIEENLYEPDLQV